LREVEQSGYEDIVSWLPCGTMFKVHDKERFCRIVMSNYFRQSRYKSFLRQLSMYNFQRVREGNKDIRGAYSHKYFRKEKVHLSQNILRTSKYSPLDEDERENSDDMPITQDSCNKQTHVFPMLDDSSRGSLNHANFHDRGDTTHENLTQKSFKKETSGNFIQDSHWGSLNCENYIAPFLLEAQVSADILDEIINTFGSKTEKKLHLLL
jgi:hypothetical protein